MKSLIALVQQPTSFWIHLKRRGFGRLSNDVVLGVGLIEFVYGVLVNQMYIKVETAKEVSCSNDCS